MIYEDTYSRSCCNVFGLVLARPSPNKRYARSVLPRPRANISQYGPRARLVRGYYLCFIFDQNYNSPRFLQVMFANGAQTKSKNQESFGELENL